MPILLGNLMSFISRDALLKKRPRRTTVVTISTDHPESDLRGKQITVRALNARERSEWETQFLDRKGKPIASRQQQIRERLVIATVVDEAGNPLFDDSDLAALREVDASLLELIVSASQELNDISEEDLKAIEKNSPTTPTGSSNSK